MFEVPFTTNPTPPEVNLNNKIKNNDRRVKEDMQWKFEWGAQA